MHIFMLVCNIDLGSSYYLIKSDIVNINRRIINAYGNDVVVLWVESNKCCCRWWRHECCHPLHKKCKVHNIGTCAYHKLRRKLDPRTDIR